MAYTAGGIPPAWVSGFSYSGSGPGGGGNPNTSGAPSGGSSGGYSSGATLAPLMTLNPSNGLTFRLIGTDIAVINDYSGQ